MKRSSLLSVTAAGLPPAPKASFLTKPGTWIMGVLNVTPDSFYAGSRVPRLDDALQRAQTLIDEGADCLDLGAESTRPGSAPVDASTQLQRLLPVVDALRARWPEMPLSIDTQKAEVARQTLSRGASLVNDISGLRHDPAMAEVAADAQCPVVVMHMQGTPDTMQREPRYGDVVDEIKSFFEERMAFLTRQGVARGKIILDPGIGFGKTLAHNLMILKRLGELTTLGCPVLVGASRKSFIGKWLAPSPLPSPEKREGEISSPISGEGALPPEDRLEGSLAAALWAVQEGARGLRVHDVAATRRAVRLWEGIAAA